MTGHFSDNLLFRSRQKKARVEHILYTKFNATRKLTVRKPHFSLLREKNCLRARCLTPPKHIAGIISRQFNENNKRQPRFETGRFFRASFFFVSENNRQTTRDEGPVIHHARISLIKDESAVFFDIFIFEVFQIESRYFSDKKYFFYVILV